MALPSCAAYESLIDSYTSSGKLHGAIAKCIDSHGQTLYSHTSGPSSLSSSDTVLKYASATKLLTSIALLQCVDRGLIPSLDSPLNDPSSPSTFILPELASKEILQPSAGGGGGEQPPSVPSTTPITPRHLLTHTSGLAYRFMDPLLMKWAAENNHPDPEKRFCHEKYNHPLVFEPGQGWAYGTSLDWAGVVVKRLHDNQSLDDWMVENIWRPLRRCSGDGDGDGGHKSEEGEEEEEEEEDEKGQEGGSSSSYYYYYPTFSLEGGGKKKQEYKNRLMQGATRLPESSSSSQGEGGLLSYTHTPSDEFFAGSFYNPHDQEGGSGLMGTADDFLGVLGDLISEKKPKLLSREMIAEMFVPQIDAKRNGGKAMQGLLNLRPAWELPAGGQGIIKDEMVNHGLGGLLVDEGEEKGRKCLVWGGATNIVWFVEKEKKVAGFWATQLAPFGDARVREVVDAWREGFWRGRGGGT